MKKGLMMLTVLATTFALSCGPKEEKPTEVIVIEKPAEEPAPAAVPPAEKEGTSIEVNKDGVKINSDKTSVDVNDGKAKVEIKN
jgi:hypothetical protein